MAKIKPIQFNFSENAYNSLTQLKEDIEAPSKTEVVRLALSVLAWLVGELKQGHKIMVEREKGRVVELNFPYLHVKSETDTEEPLVAR